MKHKVYSIKEIGKIDPEKMDFKEFKLLTVDFIVYLESVAKELVLKMDKLGNSDIALASLQYGLSQMLKDLFKDNEEHLLRFLSMFINTIGREKGFKFDKEMKKDILRYIG